VFNNAFNTENKFQDVGDNYETKVGSCIRDFIHVEDLALAHIFLQINYFINQLKLESIIQGME